MTIAIGQVPKLVGVPKTSGDFFEQARVCFAGSETSTREPPDQRVSLLVVLVVRRWLPVVPGSQIVVLLAIAANAALQLDHHAVGHRGPVESGLPAT